MPRGRPGGGGNGESGFPPTLLIPPSARSAQRLIFSLPKLAISPNPQGEPAGRLVIPRKRPQYCCATFRRSENNRNVGTCQLRQKFVGFKLHATSANIFVVPCKRTQHRLETCRYLAGRGGEGYQFFKEGSQKILTLPLNANKKIVTLPQPYQKKIVTLPTSIQSYFLRHYCPELNCPAGQIDSCLTDAQSVSYFF